MSSSDRYVLAIDLGTSGPKAALFTTKGRLLGHEFESNSVEILPGGGAEQDPEEWWSAIKTATRRLLDRGLVPPEQIVAVGATAQWSGTVAVDRDGKHLMNAVIWMDSRGQRYVKEITGGLVNIQGYSPCAIWSWLRLTGGMPGLAGKDPIAHILFIKNERPEVYAKTHRFLEVKDYINYRLTGRFAASYDSMVLHWLTDNRDISNIRYDEGLLRRAGIAREKMPEMQGATDILGTLKPEVAAELGLPAEAKVPLGTADLQSAAIGSGAVLDYQGHLYVGTSDWLICPVPYKKTDILHAMASLPSPIPGSYLVTNEQETAGGALNFLRDRIFFADDELTEESLRAPGLPEDAYPAFDRLAESVPPGSDKLIFTPWLYGERTPVEDHQVRGGFFNLSLNHTRAHMVRAVYEGVAFNARWLLQYVEKFIHRPLDGLNFIGGGARSRIWCQIIADVFDRQIRQIKDPIHANARGIAYLTSVAAGHLTFDEIPGLVEVEETFEPNPVNRELYDELFAIYLKIYEQNKGLYERLNRLGE